MLPQIDTAAASRLPLIGHDGLLSPVLLSITESPKFREASQILTTGVNSFSDSGQSQMDQQQFRRDLRRVSAASKDLLCAMQTMTATFGYAHMQGAFQGNAYLASSEIAMLRVACCRYAGNMLDVAYEMEKRLLLLRQQRHESGSESPIDIMLD